MSTKEERKALRKQKNLLPQQVKQDEFQLYRSNLLNPLLTELVAQNRLGSLQEARDEKDQIKFSGLYKVETYTKDLKTAIEALPTYAYTAYPGDVLAGVQIHQSARAGVKAVIARPQAIDFVGSYFQNTTLTPSYNIDINVTLPELYLTERDFQDYGYFDKKAMYVAALATHLKHFGDLRFANLHITHEVHDPLKPIIIIQPSEAMDVDQLQQIKSKSHKKGQHVEMEGSDDEQDTLRKPSGLLGKFRFIIHVVASVTRIPLRKLAPNRNNVKTIEVQQWFDPSGAEFALKPKQPTFITSTNNNLIPLTDMNTTPLNETILIPNVAPTPDYNHSILQDLLSTSQHYIFATLLSESKLMQHMTILIKIWLKLRGLYIDTCPVLSNQDTTKIHQQTGHIDLELTQKYQQLLSQYQSQTKQPDADFTTILTATKITYNYRHHFMHHSMGLSGWQVTYLVLNLFLQKKITPANTLQLGMDTFFRSILLHYPDNTNTPSSHTFLPSQRTTLNTTHDSNLIHTPLILPPANSGAHSAISPLQQAQSDYASLTSQSAQSAQSAQSTLTTGLLFHAFDVVMVDCNGVMNVLHNISLPTWHNIQAHALLSLKLTYGNNVGSLLSHDITPQLLSGNLAFHLKHSQLAPQTDQDIFVALYMTKLTNTKHAAISANLFYPKGNHGDDIDLDDYLSEIHSLYIAEISQLCDLGYYCDGVLKTALPHQTEKQTTLSPFQLGDKLTTYNPDINHQYLSQLHKQAWYNEDLSLLAFDTVYDVTLPVSKIPFYPILSSHLHTNRQHRAELSSGGSKLASKTKKTPPATTNTAAKKVMLTDLDLFKENLYKVGMISSKSLPVAVLAQHKVSSTWESTSGKVKKLQQTINGVEQTAEGVLIDGDIAQYVPHLHQPTLPTYLAMTYRIRNILEHSLMNRVFTLFVEPQLNPTHTSFIWRVSVKFNPAEAARSLDKGPHAEQVQRCKEWKAWWGGNKSELRRFPDGAIMEVVVWDYRGVNPAISAGQPFDSPTAPNSARQKHSQNTARLDHQLHMNYNFGTTALQLPNEQIPFHIAQYILPLHLFSTSTHPSSGSQSQPSFDILYSNQVIVSTPTHSFGAFLQKKDMASFFNFYQPHYNSSVIIPDPHTILPSQHAFDKYSTTPSGKGSSSVEKKDPLVSSTLPIPTSLHTSFKMFNTLLKEELTSQLPLGIDNIEPTSAVLRGTSPFFPTPFYFTETPSPSQINNFFSSLTTSPEADITAGHNVYEPINIVLTLGFSNKWPTNDLLAINRVKTAFYLRLASVLENYKPHSTKGGASRDVKGTHDKRNGKGKDQHRGEVDDNMNNSLQGLGEIYTQVTPYYIDIYLAGYVYRCRIVNQTEISLFRAQSASPTSTTSISPLVLGGGNFRSVEREYLYRPKHHMLVKNTAQQFPLIPLLASFLSRWCSAHFFTHYITDNQELCELFVLSIFLSSAPFTIPTTFPAALSRLFYRLSQFNFLSTPLIIPTIEFSMSSDAEAKLEQEKFAKLSGQISKHGQTPTHPSPITSNHQQTFTYYHQEYNSDINIDQFPQIYHEFNQRKSTHQQCPLIYLVTSYDMASKAWTMRPANHFFYKDHFNTLLQQLTHGIVDKNSKTSQDGGTSCGEIKHQLFNHFLPKLREQLFPSTSSSSSSSQFTEHDNDDDNDDIDDGDMLVSLFYQELQQRDEKKQILRDFYGSLIDHGDAPSISPNTSQLITSISYNDLFAFQFATRFAFLSINTLFHFSNTFSAIPIHSQSLPPLTPSTAPTPAPLATHFKTTQWAIKTPVRWTFQHFTSLFKPQLDQFDAFILIKPDAFSIDQMQRGLWLYNSKMDHNDDKSTSSALEYRSFLTRSLLSRGGHRSSDTSSHHKRQDKSAADFGPALPAHLQSNTISLLAGQNYIQSYLDELRASFGQYASFYCDGYGSRVIGVKFHPFIASPSAPSSSTTSSSYDPSGVSLDGLRDLFMTRAKERQDKSATKAAVGFATNLPLHTQHPLHFDLHLSGTLLFGPKQTGKKAVPAAAKSQPTTAKLQTNLVDLLAQMAQTGDGIVQSVYSSYEDFSDHVYV